jgi:transportin-1
VSTALGVHFKPFAEPVFTRCVNLVYKTLEGCQLATLDPTLDQPDKDFMIVALDLLSGIVQGLNTSVESLVANARPPLVQLLSMCINVSTYRICNGASCTEANYFSPRIQFPK